MNIKQEKLTIKTEIKPENDKHTCVNSNVDDKPMLIDLAKIKTEFNESGKNNGHLYIISAQDIRSLGTEEIQIKSDNGNCTTTTTTTKTTSKKRKRKQKPNSKNVKKYCNKTIPNSNSLANQVKNHTSEKCSESSQFNTAFKDKYNLSVQVKKRTASNNKVPKKQSKSHRKKKEPSEELKKASLCDKNVQSTTNIPGHPSLQVITPPVEVIVIDDTEIHETLPAVNASKAGNVPEKQPGFNPQSAPAKHVDKVPPTKRIVDLNHVLNWALPMQTDHSRSCPEGKVYLSEEQRLGKGLVSRLIFACTKCTQTFVYDTDPEGYDSKLNKGFVRTTLSIGCSYDKAKRLLRGIGIPSMKERTFKVFSGKLGGMWPIFYAALRNYAPYITLPFAAVVGVIGYNLENWISDKYTPYNKSIEEQRTERLLKQEKLESAENVEKLKYKANVLNTNLSPSLS